MASVTKCDKCGAVVKHEESLRLAIYRRDTHGYCGSTVADAELCRGCYESVCSLLNLKVKK